jgi:hypothetical protein
MIPGMPETYDPLKDMECLKHMIPEGYGMPKAYNP